MSVSSVKFHLFSFSPKRGSCKQFLGQQLCLCAASFYGLGNLIPSLTSWSQEPAFGPLSCPEHFQIPKPSKISTDGHSWLPVPELHSLCLQSYMPIGVSLLFLTHGILYVVSELRLGPFDILFWYFIYHCFVFRSFFYI